MTTNLTAQIHSFESFGTLDGPGIRFVIFFQGCPYRCIYCHNPDSWNPSAGQAFTADQILTKVMSCRNFIKNGGVTLSGGEPLMQKEFCLELIKKLNNENIPVAIDTSGAINIDRVREVIDQSSMLLLDIKAFPIELCQTITRSSQNYSISYLNYCESIGKKVWIRHVLVPNYTLDYAQLKKLADFLKPYHCIERIELLKYHKMAEFKWQQLNLINPLANTPEPTNEIFEAAKQYFDHCLL